MDTAPEKELAQRLAAVEAREEAVAKRERGLAAKGIRQNLYDRVTLSARSLDYIILGCAAAIVALIVAGIRIGN